VRSLADILPTIDVVPGDGYNSSPTNVSEMGPDARIRHVPALASQGALWMPWPYDPSAGKLLAEKPRRLPTSSDEPFSARSQSEISTRACMQVSSGRDAALRPPQDSSGACSSSHDPQYAVSFSFLAAALASRLGRRQVGIHPQRCSSHA
jgi:hypothetical protein